MTKLLGIDDAGRGPVIGPMVLAGVLIDENEYNELKSFEAKDSKTLSRNQRLKIRDKIQNRFEHHIEISTSKEIDNSTNLNYLEAQKAAEIINQLTKKTEEEIKAIIDCPSVNIKSWSDDVQKLLNKPKQIILKCEHKADENHPIVSAASILAKETREEELDKLRDILDVEFGSGYPSDPKTKEFIKENYNNPKYKDIIRFSWNTVKRLQKAESQKRLF